MVNKGMNADDTLLARPPSPKLSSVTRFLVSMFSRIAILEYACNVAMVSFAIDDSAPVEGEAFSTITCLFLYLDVETGSTTTTARCQGVVHNLKLGPDQLHREVDLAPF